MADTGSRRKIMGWGLTVWSGLTALNGMAGSFWSFLLIPHVGWVSGSQLRAGGQLADR